MTIALLIIVVSAGCKSSNNADHVSDEDINKYLILPLYNAMEIEVSGEWKTVPVADSYIRLDPESDRNTILNHIASELSSGYFNDLKIEILHQDGENGEDGMIKINLAEMDSYTGPGSVKAYNSWYDFFQGSAGGTNTTITLRESFLQRTYKGEWIEAVQFMYMGEPFPESDHVHLSGIITRY
ncbi:MAG: hypothetical protein LC649_09980 [Bacteroidales bacterium]|nr:hypothetical protein [Bacteroidales bacterium]